MKIAISIGHYPSKPGYTFKRDDGLLCSEYAMLAPVVGYAIRRLMQEGHEAWMVPSGTLSQKTAWENRRKFDLALEIHANADPDPDRAGDHVASGSEVLFYPMSKRSEKLAHKVAHLLAAKIGEVNRGAKPGWWRTDPSTGKILGWLRKTKATALIVEVCFMDDPEGMRKVDENAEQLGTAIAAAVLSAHY